MLSENEILKYQRFNYFFSHNKENIVFYGSKIKGDLLQCYAPASIFFNLNFAGCLSFCLAKNKVWEGERKKCKRI